MVGAMFCRSFSALYARREWRTFKNAARKDSLELGHWVKATSDLKSGKVDNDTIFTRYAHSSFA
jgi:hypothetical protein